MKVKCDWCGGEAITYPSRMKRTEYNFCSQTCWHKFQVGKPSLKNKQVKKNCDQCGKEIMCSLPKLKRYENHFCSRECMGLFRKGQKRPKHSEYMKKNPICSMLGKKLSPERKAQLLACHLGRKLSEEHKAKLLASRLGKKSSEETRTKISIGRIGKYCGEQNPNWKGGVSLHGKQRRMTPRYRAWRKKVYERDNYTCQRCGDNKGGKLRAHHMKHWKPNKKLRYDVDNGVTICNLCHEGFLHTKKARVLNPYEIGQTVLKI